MNAAEKARLEYLRELPSMEIEANLSALVKSADYAEKFNCACERREIRRAGERAHWLNIVFPLLKSGKGMCSA
jgi:hypothetical protein